LHSEKKKHEGLQLPLLGKNVLPLQFNDIIDLYELIITRVMECIVSRYNRRDAYPWVDTKIDILTGKDYNQDDLVRGPNTVYGWIQGRALEAIADHCVFLDSERDAPVELTANLKVILEKVLVAVVKAKQLNNGRIPFFMDTDGEAIAFNKDMQKTFVKCNANDAFTYSDLFCSKGMYKAAKLLGQDKLASQAADYCCDVTRAIINKDFISGQFSFEKFTFCDSDATVNLIGPYMLQLSAIESLLSNSEDVEIAKDGILLIQHLLDTNVNLNNKWPWLKPYDCVEVFAGNTNLTPADNVITDPGHTLEFVGLSLKFVDVVNKLKLASQINEDIGLIVNNLTEIFFRSFSTGFSSAEFGIHKTVNLLTRKPVNDNMPWWSLPEAMRTAMYLLKYHDSNQLRNRIFSVYSSCHNAFIKHYLRPDVHYMAVKTLSCEGIPIDDIPAVPDADPGYHTGLSLIDCINIIRMVYVNH
jgi:hypothetical protein